jgi:hypothetical protein
MIGCGGRDTLLRLARIHQSKQGESGMGAALKGRLRSDSTDSHDESVRIRPPSDVKVMLRTGTDEHDTRTKLLGGAHAPRPHRRRAGHA